MRPTLETSESTAATWREFEQFFADLDRLARDASTPEGFYSGFLATLVPLLAGQGGAVWQLRGGRWVPLAEINLGRKNPTVEQFRLLNEAAHFSAPQILSTENCSEWFDLGDRDAALVLAPVEVEAAEGDVLDSVFVVGLALRGGAAPAVQRGWTDFLAAACQSALRFHLRDQLRQLRAEQASNAALVSLLAACQRTTDLKQVAAEIANSGATFVHADRLSLVLKQGEAWQLAAVNGVASFDRYSESVQSLQELSASTANWGEMLQYAEGMGDGQLEDLPPRLSAALQGHLDCSPAKQLLAVPLLVKAAETDDRPSNPVHAVLVAESYGTAEQPISRDRLVELAHFCSTPLVQAQELDRFAVRSALSLTSTWQEFLRRWGMHRLTLAVAGLLAVALALIYVPCDFEVAAPGELVPRVERHLFAPSRAVIREILVKHGEPVTGGQVIARLESPELEIELEQVQGELATTQKRLHAIAVARTDRQSEEAPTESRLPLSAEAEQLKLRQASLAKQARILEQRIDELTVRSPLTGVITTLDAQDLLRDRPVERGQQLLTVSDEHSGWKLRAQVPQDLIGHVVHAQQNAEEVGARFKLAGASEEIYSGHMASIAQAAVAEPEDPDSDFAAVPVEIAIEEDLPAARPGMAADVRILCGRRSLGYVWLHDAWENIYSWVAF